MIFKDNLANYQNAKKQFSIVQEKGFESRREGSTNLPVNKYSIIRSPLDNVLIIQCPNVKGSEDLADTPSL